MSAEKKLKPYFVDITEKYSRRVIVWAEDNFEAEVIADDLCSEDVIKIDSECFVSRNTEAYNATPSEVDMQIFEQFCGKGKIDAGEK